MAVLIEACSVVIRLAALPKIPGGLNALKTFSPVGTLCIDNELIRVGFMSGDEAEAYCRRLLIEGLESGLPGPQKDFCIVDQIAGVIGPVNWLETGRITLAAGKQVWAARLKGSTNNTLFSPDGWKYEESISANPTYVSKSAVNSEMEFIRHDNGIDVFRDRRTGREMFRPSSGSAAAHKSSSPETPRASHPTAATKLQGSRTATPSLASTKENLREGLLSSYRHRPSSGDPCALCGEKTRPLAYHVLHASFPDGQSKPQSFVPMSSSMGLTRGSYPLCDKCAPKCGKCQLPIQTEKVLEFGQLMGARPALGVCQHMHLRQLMHAIANRILRRGRFAKP